MARVPPLQIVAAADFGDESATALWVAGSLAAAFASELVVVHAESLEAPIYFTHEQVERLELERVAARQTAQQFTRAFAERHSPAPVSRVEVVDGPPADAILRLIQPVDLVVLGTHGYRGARRWWLGSVAERVVREAPVPVLVAHALPVAPTPWTPARLTILGERPGTRVSAWATALSAWAQAPVAEASSIAQCDRESVAGSSLVIVPLTGSRDESPVADLGQVLTGCLAPVLFVPDYD
jgi:nucleotide-binding universal stress UspA family protein